MIITIDGCSGAGKTTVAKALSEKLGIPRLDSGAIYRAFALFLDQEGVDTTSDEAIRGAHQRFSYWFEESDKETRHYINGVDVSDAIRTPNITELSSKLSAIKVVRELVMDIQADCAKSGRLIAEGRDMGTVVFPHADYKFFLTANIKKRAERRYQEMMERCLATPGECSVESVKRDMESRDRCDSERKISPMIIASEAITIDTTERTVPEVVEKIESILFATRVRRRSIFSYIYGKSFSRSGFVFGFAYMIARSLLRLLYRLEGHGVENIPKGRALIAANHVSYLDPPAVGCCYPEPSHAVAGSHLYRGLFGKLIRAMGAIPVSNSANDATSIKEIVSVLLDGQKMIVFPEASRSMDGKLKKFKRGVATIAALSQAAIVPAYIKGAREVWPRRKKLPKLFGKIDVYYGVPLFYKDYISLGKKQAQEKMLEDLEASVKALRDQYDPD